MVLDRKFWLGLALLLVLVFQARGRLFERRDAAPRRRFGLALLLVLLAGGPAPAQSTGKPAPAPAPTVSYLDAAEVNRAFAGGAALLETPQYRVIASRRDQAGEAEVHTRETDVIYVTQGKALLVTGGRVVQGRNTSADEIRGTAIEAGAERALGPGDVVVIPAGVPHWFKSVEPPFLYFTVKPISANGH